MRVTAFSSARLLATAAAVLAAAATAPPSALGAGAWPWPVEGDVLTPYRNGPDPYAAGQHRGIDIGAPEGDGVRAAAGGTVTFAGTVGSSGAVVAIRTGDGRFDTSYLHLRSIEVRSGEEVSAGDRVGTVGTSGVRSTAAPHLHFGVRAAGQEHAYRDPMRFLAPPGGPAPEPPAPVVAPVRVGPVPDAVPPRVPRLAARPAGPPQSAPAPERGPVPEPRIGPKGAGAFEPLPAPRIVRSLSRTPAPAPAPAGPLAPLAGGLGWALACAGLLLAGALACTPRGRQRTRAGARAPGRRQRARAAARARGPRRGSAPRSGSGQVAHRGEPAPLDGGTQVAG